MIRDGDGWLMAYSGLAVAEGTARQRIGFARSLDLATWTRVGPVLEAGPELVRVVLGRQRDSLAGPMGWRHADGRSTCLSRPGRSTGPDDERGVIGHAASPDGERWDIGPPVSVPGELRQLEVPQLLEAAPDRWVVLASCHVSDHSAARRARPGSLPRPGPWPSRARSPLGPFTIPPGRFLDGSPDDSRYAGRIVELDGRMSFLTWLDRRPDGSFAGELCDPIPVDVDGDGRLRLVIR